MGLATLLSVTISYSPLVVSRIPRTWCSDYHPFRTLKVASVPGTPKWVTLCCVCDIFGLSLFLSPTNCAFSGQVNKSISVPRPRTRTRTRF
uniref:IP18247p n=1 Tax=Drosophila melanogaster TaxID=7227 RepID=A2VER7_DROME|nr:IP18247p [Drosophila melanogaster]